MEEIEAKFLDINVEAIKDKLSKMGAVKVSDGLLKQKVFDFSGWPLDKKAAWLRLRDDGGKVSLAYKQRLGVKDSGKNDDGMEEVETQVGDFDKTALIMEKLGMELKFYEEKKRVVYKLGNVEFDIDIWPMIPAYLEIEAENWEVIDAAAKSLELDPMNKKILSAMQIFELYGFKEKEYKIITFENLIKR